jgi:hypothetical protein
MNAMDDMQIRLNGILALNQALGPSAAMRFLALVSHETTDYVAIARQLYEGQTIQDVFDRAEKTWKG